MIQMMTVVEKIQLSVLCILNIWEIASRHQALPPLSQKCADSSHPYETRHQAPSANPAILGRAAIPAHPYQVDNSQHTLSKEAASIQTKSHHSIPEKRAE